MADIDLEKVRELIGQLRESFETADEPTFERLIAELQAAIEPEPEPPAEPEKGPQPGD